MTANEQQATKNNGITVPKVSTVRLAETAVMALITSLVSTALSLYVTVNVMKTDMNNIKGSMQELKEEQKFIREQILEWYKRGGKS